MERKIDIPKMKSEDIVKWYSTIKPIVYHDGKPVYMRELTDKELTNVAYTWLNYENDYADTVDFSKLSVLADVKMLHGWGYYGLFKPSVGEVIRQIPSEMLENVVAFQIIYSPHTSSDFGLFKPEFDAGFHVSVVRLYQAKDDTNEVAEPVGEYPNEDSSLPVGMTEKEFQNVKTLLSQED